MTPAELKVEMALHLYAQGRLSIGKARELAGMALWEFRQLLASRRIPPHYGVQDLDEDVATFDWSVGGASRSIGRLRMHSVANRGEPACGQAWALDVHADDTGTRCCSSRLDG